MAQKDVLQPHNRKAYPTAVNCCITMLLMVSGVTGGMPFCEPTCHPQKFFQISVPDSSHWWYVDVHVRSDQNPRCLVLCLGGNEQFPSFYWEFFHQLLHKDTNSPTQDFICFHSSGWVFAAASWPLPEFRRQISFKKLFKHSLPPKVSCSTVPPSSDRRRF